MRRNRDSNVNGGHRNGGHGEYDSHGNGGHGEHGDGHANGGGHERPRPRVVCGVSFLYGVLGVGFPQLVFVAYMLELGAWSFVAAALW